MQLRGFFSRDAILEELLQWCSTRDAPNILWLHGPAGTGKSAIAQSLCERLESKKQLAASFFFTHGDTLRGNGNRLFPTIAYQLGLHLPEFNDPISRVVGRNPAIVQKSLSIQLKNLIMGPCDAVLSGRTQPIIIIIDGLDECEGEQIQQALLCTVGDATHEDIPLRFLITSQPNAHIQETFGGPLKSVYRPFNINQSFHDVEKYLQDEFSRIYHEHSDTMSTVPTPWPPSHIVCELVDKSSGYFVYASTIIKFIDDKDFRPPEHLAVILMNKIQSSTHHLAPLINFTLTYSLRFQKLNVSTSLQFSRLQQNWEV
jgi:Cdc6-like AAA superfamily ATPase